MNLPKILVPVSWDENSANSLKYAIHLAKSINAELNILYVVKEKEDKKNTIPHETIFTKESNLKYRKIIRKGEVSKEILQTASELEPEFILMGPDVYHKEKKFFEESESGKVIKNSGYPILIIPPTTEFKDIENIIYGTDLTENITSQVKELLKLFKNLNPHIDILIFGDQIPTWHYKEDVFNISENIKNNTGYLEIAESICNHENTGVGIDQYAGKFKSDLICIEKDTDVYYQLLFNQKISSEIHYIPNRPILIIGRSGGNIFKGG